MIEAGAAEHRECHSAYGRGVPAPPGANMVAPSEVPRNAEGAQSEDRAKVGDPARPRAL